MQPHVTRLQSHVTRLQPHVLRLQPHVRRVRVLGELLRLFGPETPYRLMFTIGGQIGIDCAPCGWDKTFCLNFLPLRQFPMIHFFGDKTLPGGGDFELYEHARTFGHAVGSPEDTISEVRRLFL